MSSERTDLGSVGQTGQTIVKLREGNGEPPLIIVHGGGGTIHAFGPIASKFSTALWAIQVTPDTPLTSVAEQSQFYYRKIKAERYRGPYRLAAFSASSLIILSLVKVFEQSGDTVSQVVLIDHFPTTFLCPVVGIDTRKFPDLTAAAARTELHRASIHNLCAMTRRDGGGRVPKRHKLADELWDAFSGRPASEFSYTFWKTLEAFLSNVLDFIISLPPVSANDPFFRDTDLGDRDGAMAHPAMRPLLKWMSSVKAPVTIYLASYGMRGSLPAEIKDAQEWRDLGTTRCFPNARVVYLDAGHFDILSNDDLVLDVQRDYLHVRASL